MRKRLNVTFQVEILQELDALVELGASGSRSTTLAGLVRSSWAATFPDQMAQRVLMQAPGAVAAPSPREREAGQ